MEPMTLGSPGNVSPGFVPSFLMGEMAAAAVSPRESGPWSSSVSELMPSTSQAAEAGTGSGTPLRAPRRVSFAPDSPMISHSLRFATPPQQQQQQRKGPPVTSLSDTLQDSSLDQSGLLSQSFTTSTPPQPAMTYNAGTHHSLGQSFGARTPTLSFSATTPLQQTPGQQSFTAATPTSSRISVFDNETKDEELWVTIFGFPPSMTPAVLTWLSSCGTISVRHLPDSPRANWLHLRFSCAAEARRALAQHRHMLGPDTMLGVGPCTDRAVMHSWRKSNESFSEAGGTFLFSSSQQLNSSNVPAPGLRPLVASPDMSVEPSLLPRRSTGVVSKAMDYIFGW